MSDKLLILDGNSVLHRAYYALPDWRNRSGEATAGVYGFLAMMLKAFEELKPTHVVVVFDCPEPTFRHTMYVGYQTNREKERQVSEDIWGQVEKLKIVLEKMEIPVFFVPGFEADDVAGTLVRQAISQDLTPGPSPTLGEGSNSVDVVVITGDKDYMQLVDDRVTLFMPQKGLSDGVIIDRNKVKEKLGVWPEQVTDYKALVGDTSDNYPGVAGIGSKTAVKLLEEYKNFEEVVKKSGNAKVVAGYEGGELSKRLATMRTDVPVTLQLSKAGVPGEKKIIEVLNELGYKSLVKRRGGKPDESSTSPRLFE